MAKALYEILLCDCEYYEDPCPFCETDAIVLYNGKPMRKSEAIEKENKNGRHKDYTGED